MNSKVEKKIRKHAEKLMVEWLQTILPDEEKEKVSVENISDYIPNQTHVYANLQLRISSYTLRWFIKKLKYLVNKKHTLELITLKEIENV
jgi:hypothetical protein